MADPTRPDGIIYNSRPLYPRPVTNWKKFMLDANSKHVEQFTLFAADKYSQGRRSLSAEEVYRDFCLSVTSNCLAEMNARLGGRGALERVNAYKAEMAEWMNSHPGKLEIVKNGAEAERIKPKNIGQTKGNYTHRLYINPKLSAMKDVMELLLETQELAMDRNSTVGNTFQFKAIAPDAMLLNGKADCVNFVRPDRVIVSFHEDDFRQVGNIIFMLNLEIGKEWLLDQRPAFSIPYVHDYKGENRMISFGLYGNGLRYGHTISEMLSSAYFWLAQNQDFSLDAVRARIEYGLGKHDKSVGEPILELVHRLYCGEKLNAALEYMKNERNASE